MERKDLDLDRLIYYSNKLKNYLAKKLTDIKDSISTLSSKVDSDKVELEEKITDGDSNVASQIVSATNTLDTKITGVDSKIDNLKDQVDNIDLNIMDGDIVNLNKVEQFVFNNLKAGDVVEIPNKSGNTDFIIDCYTDTGTTPTITYNTTTFNTGTTDTFSYDPRFIEVTSTGIRPKDTITLNYTKTIETYNGMTYYYYVSDVIPEELMCNTNAIVSITEE